MSVEEGKLKLIVGELIKQVTQLNIVTQNAIGVLGISRTCDLYNILTQQQNNLGELYRILQGDSNERISQD